MDQESFSCHEVIPGWGGYCSVIDRYPGYWYIIGGMKAYVARSKEFAIDVTKVAPAPSLDSLAICKRVAKEEMRDLSKHPSHP